ncbi:hypothetical protein WJX77_003353 [Trebouxia sp. C0004]
MATLIMFEGRPVRSRHHSYEWRQRLASDCSDPDTSHQMRSADEMQPRCDQVVPAVTPQATKGPCTLKVIPRTKTKQLFTASVRLQKAMK